MKFTNLDNELQFAIKETKTIAKIIKSGSTCLCCFISNPFVIEWHHVGGRKSSSFLIPLCANCHLLASKNQLSYDLNWNKHEKSEPEKARFVIQDLEFLIDLIKRRFSFGTNRSSSKRVC